MSSLRIALMIIFIVICVVITVIVLMQEGKSQGLGSLSGQTSSDTYWAKNKKHSKEGWLVRITSALVVLFFVLAAILNISTF